MFRKAFVRTWEQFPQKRGDWYRLKQFIAAVGGKLGFELEVSYGTYEDCDDPGCHTCLEKKSFFAFSLWLLFFGVNFTAEKVLDEDGLYVENPEVGGSLENLSALRRTNLTSEECEGN